MGNKRFTAITVYNKSLPVDMFDRLCDALSGLRWYCHDYRMVTGYYGQGFWQSASYDIDANLLGMPQINTVFESVEADVACFCRINHLSIDSVKIEQTDLYA